MHDFRVFMLLGKLITNNYELCKLEKLSHDLTYIHDFERQIL